MKSLLLSFVLLVIGISGFAQQNLIYNHYFINPYLYNPSYIAPSGYTEVHLNYRKQWSGIKGAPETGTFNLQVPLSYRSGFGVTAYQDKAGVLTTTAGMLSFSYQIYFGQKVTNNRLGFGISAGVIHSFVDSPDADPSIANNNTTSMDGQFGLNYQYNRFKIAFAIPQIFDTRVVSEENFNKPGITKVKNTISSISYEFPLGERFSFEPIAMYRTYENTDGQFEGLGVLRFTNVGWIGGAYRQNSSAAGLIGFNIKDRFKVGYAYEFATSEASRIGNGSHEFQLSIRVGKTQKVRPGAVAKKITPVDSSQLAVAKKPVVEEPKEEEPEEIKHEAPPAIAKNEPLVKEEKVTPPPVVTTPPVQQQAQHEPARESKEVVKHVPIKEDTLANKDKELLPAGYYVVVGAFNSFENAKNYTQTLTRAGYPAEYAYHPGKGYYIVHMGNVPTIERARFLRDDYRIKSRYTFRDTWVLHIE